MVREPVYDILTGLACTIFLARGLRIDILPIPQCDNVIHGPQPQSGIPETPPAALGREPTTHPGGCRGS